MSDSYSTKPSKAGIGGGGMKVGGFDSKPAVGSTIPGGQYIKGIACPTGDAGRENDPADGKLRQNPGNP